MRKIIFVFCLMLLITSCDCSFNNVNNDMVVLKKVLMSKKNNVKIYRYHINELKRYDSSFGNCNIEDLRLITTDSTMNVGDVVKLTVIK